MSGASAIFIGLTGSLHALKVSAAVISASRHQVVIMFPILGCLTKYGVAFKHIFATPD
jgi:hypothetical protein